MPPSQAPLPPSSHAESLPLRRAYLRPQYAEPFRCIGPACEDTCCQGWSVPVDQDTYEKYVTIESMKPHLGTVIVPNSPGATRFDFARIRTTTTSACFFFDEERLCAIQKQFGPSLLSAACATYPRAVTTNSGQKELALNLSCPEAARLTLLHGNLLGSEPDTPGQATGPERYAAFVQENARLQQPAERGADNAPGDPVPYDPLLATREFALLLLTDRSYPLWQRLLLLGTVARKLQALSQGGMLAAFAVENPALVAQLLADSATIVHQNKLRAAMDEVVLQPSEQIPLFFELLRQRIAQPPVSPRLLECLQDFEAGLGCATAPSEAQFLVTFVEASRSDLWPFLERHPHLLENYLVNYVFRTNYPFGRPIDQVPENPINASDEHMLLCAQLGLLQSMLVGIAAHHREAFDDTHVVKLVQCLAKTFEHSKSFLRQITEFVTKRDLNNLRGIALLLKPTG